MDGRESNILEWWRDYPCEHQVQAAGMYGYSLNVMCEICKRACMFLYQPKSDSFEAISSQAFSPDTFKTMDDVDVKTLAVFLKGVVPVFFVPDPPGDPHGPDPIGDEIRFNEIIRLFSKYGLDIMSLSHKIGSEKTTTTCCECGHEHS